MTTHKRDETGRTMSFEEALAACGQMVEERLAFWLAKERHAGAPAGLLEAMRYSALGGGKRFRPFLVIETARMLGVAPKASLDAACALECVHCYSLVHDDLPAMDDDDLRRGRPTSHKRFGEAAAILAGDGLLTLAFEILSSPSCHADAGVRAELVLGLAKAAGPAGMVGGQMRDLAAEGRFTADGREVAASQRKPLVLNRTAIERLQAMKTGALMAFGVQAGAILGRASADERRALSAYATALGAAFQLSDDLLDAEGDAALVGKALAKDAGRGKGTLVEVLGIASAREELRRLEVEAVSALDPLGKRSGDLADAARFMARRKA
jgi:farnesyl diphosphate synthase